MEDFGWGLFIYCWIIIIMFIYHSHIILIINILRSKLKFWIKDARQEYADEAAKQKIAYDKAMEEYR